jgi:hypothetical protein
LNVINDVDLTHNLWKAYWVQDPFHKIRVITYLKKAISTAGQIRCAFGKINKYNQAVKMFSFKFFRKVP